MRRLAELVLISALILAVLAFGGTEPLSFSVVQVLLLALGILLILGYGKSWMGKPKLPVAIPLTLVALVLLQILPLWSSTVQRVRGEVGLPGGPGSATLSIAPDQTLSHLLFLLTYLAAFYLSATICQRRDGKRLLVFALLGVGAFEALYGLVQYLTGWQQIFTYVKRFSLADATGTYINRNHFAGLLAMILPFALALALHQLRRLRDEVRAGLVPIQRLWSKTESQKLIFSLFLAVFLFTALVFSRSRMGIVAASISILSVATLVITSTRQRRTVVLLVVVFLLAASAMVSWIGLEPVLFRFEQLGQELIVSNHGRWAIWQDTLQVIRGYPWLGSGLGTFPVSYTTTQNAYPNRVVNHAHNDYLELASELGLPGAFLLFASIFYLLGRTIKKYRAGGDGFDRAIAAGCTGSLVAVLLCSLTDFNLYIPANALVFSLILGLSYSTNAIPNGGRSA